MRNECRLPSGVRAQIMYEIKLESCLRYLLERPSRVIRVLIKVRNYWRPNISNGFDHLTILITNVPRVNRRERAQCLHKIARLT